MAIQLFTKTMAQLEKALNATSKRHQVITTNIVNQDTPGYKAKDLDFKEVMKGARKKTASSIKLNKTNRHHLSTSLPAPPPFAEEITLSPSERSSRLDGNTVNSEKEMARLAENTLMYRAAAQMIASKFRGLKNVISEGR
ncbi:MAG: flagellar basal body rod protein FlgB [Nitrospiria bacterium]